MALAYGVYKAAGSPDAIVPISVDSAGVVQVAGGTGGGSGGTVTVSNFPSVQAVSASSLPLPTGAASAANQGRSFTVASDGALLELSSLAQTLVYNADDTLNYVQVVSAGNTYRQTMTWTSGKMTAVSNWVKQ